MKKNDNFGQPRQQYLDRLAAMSDDALRTECKNKIWLSAYASNNPRSDFHWQCDATYDECSKRGKAEIYSQEHSNLVAEARGR